MDFKNKIVIITGGAKGIGKQINDDFISHGAKTYVIDKLDGNHFIGDVSNKNDLDNFINYILEKEDHIDYIINNALPLFKGIDNCTYEEFNYALAVGASAPFYLAKKLKNKMPLGSVIINITSTRDDQSMPQSESYAAAKGALKALTHSLAVSLGPNIRVNSIAPGWINTKDEDESSNDINQHPVGRIGRSKDISNMVLFLCSDKASFITGEEIKIDGGMSKLMIYHNEHGWKYED